MPARRHRPAPPPRSRARGRCCAVRRDPTAARSDGCRTRPAAAPRASFHGSGPNTLRLPSSIHTSPSRRASQVPSRDARGQHAVEQLRARRRQQDACAGRAARGGRANIASALGDVVAVAAEALLAEIIRHAACGDRAQARLDRVALAVARRAASARNGCRPARRAAVSARARRASSTRSARPDSAVSSAGRIAAPTRLGRCTLKRCRVTAWRSLRPA